jgi:hypothetical protein
LKYFAALKLGWTSTGLHCVTSQKILRFMVTAVTNPNPRMCTYFINMCGLTHKELVLETQGLQNRNSVRSFKSNKTLWFTDDARNDDASLNKAGRLQGLPHDGRWVAGGCGSPPDAHVINIFIVSAT